MTAIGTDRTLGVLASESPRHLEVLEALKLDYCCGGAHTLAQACDERGLDADTVARILDGLKRSAGADPGPHLVGDTPGEICAHIVGTHHAWLREQLPRITMLLDTVGRRDRTAHPELDRLRRCFARLSSELLDHIGEEEERLFAICATIERGQAVTLSPGQLDRHQLAHRTVRERMQEIRGLTGGYAPERATCGEHRALLAALQNLEADLHQHIHEENNILFPLLEAAAAAAG